MDSNKIIYEKSLINSLYSIYRSNFGLIYGVIDFDLVVMCTYLIFVLNGTTSISSVLMFSLFLKIILIIILLPKFILELKYRYILKSNRIVKSHQLETYLPIVLLLFHASLITVYLLFDYNIIIYIIITQISVVILSSWYILLFSTIYLEYLQTTQGNLKPLIDNMKNSNMKLRDAFANIFYSLGFISAIAIIVISTFNLSLVVYIIFSFLIIFRIYYRHRQINRYITTLDKIPILSRSLTDANLKRIHWT
jgi:hypothetical protein